ncbi:deoxycytidylate deaminase protein [Rhizobium phage RHph_I42]|nr:deoxycytidylate deaminase protein [Rhizobium phage RHph_I42]
MKRYSAKWLRHFRRHALAAADKVKEPTHVGAALIGHDNAVLLTAYNGPAIGVADTGERRARKDGLKYKFSAHAERNLIAFAAKHGISTRGLTVYATHHPCSACASELVQAGIECVIVADGDYRSAGDEIKYAQQIFSDCGVQIIQHEVSALEERAINLARTALYDLRDSQGDSKFYHTQRVVDALPDRMSIHTRIVAWLHDVVEDWGVGQETALNVINSRFGNEIALDVEALTQREHESYDAAIQRLIDSDRPHALVVKLCDNFDNNDPARRIDLSEEDVAKYEQRYNGVREKIYKALHSGKHRTFIDWHNLDYGTAASVARNPYWRPGAAL